MKKAFTLIELLVVIAIIAILAAMLMPALTRARDEARKSNCKSNINNIGYGMVMFSTDNDGKWPDAYEPNRQANMYCNGFGRINGRGYVDDLDVFNCPSTGNIIETEDISSPYGDPDEEGTMPHVMFADYGYDNGRIHRNSRPGRPVIADNMRHIWADQTNGQPIESAAFPPQDPNHAAGTGGANVLFFDGTVEYINVTEANPGREQGLYSVGDPEEILWQVYHTDDTGLFLERYGTMGNPRLDVGRDPQLTHGSDPLSNTRDEGAGDFDDWDDIYLIDSVTETCVFYNATDSDVNLAGSWSWDQAPTLEVSKEDAFITPVVGFLHATGWIAN